MYTKYTPLSGTDILKMNPRSRVILYNSLDIVHSISSLFNGDTDSLIILYSLSSKTSGHWVCLFRTVYNTLVFFDSYGMGPDGELDMLLTDSQRKEYGECRDKLTKLLIPYDITWNKVCYQAPETDTCGMHVTYRLHNSDLNDEMYYNLVTRKCKEYGVDPDLLVTSYCNKYRLYYMSTL